MSEFCGVFIKFGDADHLKQLQNHGLLYCNPISYFLKIEDDILRGDVLETVIEMDYIEKGFLELRPINEPDSPLQKFNITNAKIFKTRTDPFGNLFCLHSINILENELNSPFKLDVKNKEFGNSFLLIKDTTEFLMRLKNALTDQQLKYTYDLVEYVDFSKYKGKKTVFQKDISFKYQKEFRLLIHHNTHDVIKIKIGDISDISILYESQLIDKFLLKANKP